MYYSFLNDFRQIVQDSADNAVSGINISGLVDNAVEEKLGFISGLDIASAVNHAVNELDVPRTTEFFVAVAMHKANIPELIQKTVNEAISQIELQLPTGYDQTTGYRQATGCHQTTGYSGFYN